MSKMPKGVIPWSAAMPATMRLVDVPMSVMQPPRTATMLRGIISFLSGTPVTCDNLKMIGISTTTTGVLLRKAEASVAPSMTSTIARRGCFSARFMTKSAARLMVPVRMSAPASTNIAPMVSGALFEKTENSPFSSSSPSAA